MKFGLSFFQAVTGTCLFAFSLLATGLAYAQTTEGDPYGSFQWPDLKREFLGSGTVVFDERVKVQGPAFAEDPLNVPITVSADGLADVTAASSRSRAVASSSVRRLRKSAAAVSSPFASPKNSLGRRSVRPTLSSTARTRWRFMPTRSPRARGC